VDHERRFDRDDREEPPNEGVRIIGAEEAAEAMERGDIAQRRGEGEPRYGDRPPPPPADGPRPVLRFPLGSSSNPHDLGRSAPVDPISEPVELPHWTQPPTGQVPQILPDQPTASRDEPEDWAGFATSQPRWQDDPSRDEGAGYDASWGDDDRLGALDDSERPSHDEFFSFADLDEQGAPSRSVFAGVDDDEPATYASDRPWEDEEQQQPQPGFLEEPDEYYDEPSRRVATGQRVGRAISGATHRIPRGPRGGGGGGGGGGLGGMDRDLGQAAVVGGGLMLLALILLKLGPIPGLLLVVVVIGLASAELFGVLRQAGYQPLVPVGVTASVAMVIATYNYGPVALPTCLFLTTVVAMAWYVVGAATESPVLSIGVTLLGSLWVGMFGSFAGAMLALHASGHNPGNGILLATIIGTACYDIGGLFVGKNAGRQPLSAHSPNKTVEGLVGGCVIAIIVVVLISAAIGFGPVDSAKDGFLLGLVVAIAAPIGDLCQSVIKRDLGVKDMGSVLPGHGGLLDRFDGLLFALPAVWLLATVHNFF
jgi:phosphatidate cytidylyltransferase